VAREFRKLNTETPLIILSADDGSFYSKPVISNAYAQGKTPEMLPISDRHKMADQLKAEIRTFTRVTGLDVAAKTVQIEGESFVYSQLVLALGADPIHLSLPGGGAGRVMAVNDLADYARFRQNVAGARRILIMGAGLIGCEFADDLQHAGIGVDLVDPAPYPLSRFVPEPVGRALQRALAEKDVTWHLGETVSAIEVQNSALSATLSGGQQLRIDAVLSSIGLRPRTQLAEAAALKTQRGIVVDRHLQTSASGVYALGDCAEVVGLVLPFVMPIMQAARALAKTLAGEPAPVAYPAMPVVVKTPSYPVVVSPPLAGIAGDWEVDQEDGGLRALFYDNNRALQGFALSGSVTAEKNQLAKLLPPLLA
jgi:rubredoxin-NAD+ reductase